MDGLHANLSHKIIAETKEWITVAFFIDNLFCDITGMKNQRWLYE